MENPPLCHRGRKRWRPRRDVARSGTAVSLFDPADLAKLLGLPDGSDPIAVLCLGPVEAFYPRPMLESEGWAQRRPLDELLSRA